MLTDATPKGGGETLCLQMARLGAEIGGRQKALVETVASSSSFLSASLGFGTLFEAD